MAEKLAPLATSDVSVDAGKIFLEDLKRTTADLKESLLPIINDTQRSIDEQAFVDYFLPMFSGEYGNDRAKIMKTLAQWYIVAGSPYLPVSVVKNGKVVAVVPAVHQNILTGKPTGRQEDVGSIFENAKQQSTLHPKLGHNITVVALHDRYMVGIPRPDLSEEQTKWFKLLNQYGKAPASMLAVKPGAAPASAGDDDDFDYE